jgi:CRISPR/Cas system-associated exonuclease Cas4 (RecB family)
MATVKLGKAVPWSYSSLQAFETCPRRFYLTKIIKTVVEGQNPAMLEGNRKHKILEDFVKGKGGLQDLESMAPLMKRLVAEPGQKVAELQFGLTQDLRPTKFFGDDVWVRGKLDLSIVGPKHAFIFDYKTGKRKTDFHQLRLFAGAAFAMWPYVETVSTGYVWLPQVDDKVDRPKAKIDTEQFARADKEVIFQDFAARVFKIEEAERTGNWEPTPSGLCQNYCPVGRGNCEHCGS